MKPFLSLVVLAIFSVQHARAAVLFQLSPPGVQQSAFQELPSYLTENFNSLSSFASSGTLAVGNYSTSGNMAIKPADKYGGAGGTGKYAFTDSNGQLSVTLLEPSRYFGLWFSCSNPGNYVDAYNGENLLATFNTQSLTDIVGLKESPNSVLASDGNTYSGDLWYGNPNPGMNDSDVSRFIYAYVNMGLSDPNATFDRIVFRGEYFEFDNLTTSPIALPEPSTYAMALAGLACVGYLVRRRRKRA
jgi:hypothetical protein